MLAAGLAAFSPATALAQAKLEARYVATLAGIPLGRGAWVIDVAEDSYTAAASGAASGLVQVLAPGQGSGAARGAVQGQQLVPSGYAASITSNKKTDEVRMSLANGNVREYSVLPPVEPTPDRLPVTDIHRRGVLDPMTASLISVPGQGDMLAPESCRRHMAVFDGRLRYDLNLEFKRMERVRAEKGYEGPVIVCATYFSPIAGHIPTRAALRYLAAQRDMEVWFAPIAGTRVLVPFRFSVPTPLGTGVLQATQFVVTPAPARASMRTP